MWCRADGSDLFQEELFLRDFSIADQTQHSRLFKDIQTHAKSEYTSIKRGTKDGIKEEKKEGGEIKDGLRVEGGY